MLAVQAANYLNIKGLLDLTCQTVANMIKGEHATACARSVCTIAEHHPGMGCRQLWLIQRQWQWHCAGFPKQVQVVVSNCHGDWLIFSFFQSSSSRVQE